jgi:hypothetical protein
MLMRSLVAAGVVAMVAAATSAQITIPSANLGSDGSLNPFQNRTITLGSAVTGNWEQAGTGFGVYDADKWAVVYKYSSVTIPAGVTVSFANHPSRAPVVWLVNGDVTINGTLNVDGSALQGAGFAQAGPGGFRGGAGSVRPVSAGLGPGGGNFAEGGGYGTFGASSSGGEVGGYVYGSADCIPLIGGSGGGGSTCGGSGGGGGGAILIVASGTITLNGSIRANGGDGYVVGFPTCGYTGSGSGGAVRLVCNTLVGSSAATITCASAGPLPGGFGRIRTESNFDTLPIDGLPVRSRATVGPTAKLWPDATKPKITTVSLGNKPVPADPRGLFTFGDTDVELNSLTPAVLTIDAQNVPLNATLEVRVVPITQNQSESRINASFQSGSFASSTWRATLPLTDGVASVTVSVIMP